MFEQDLQLKIAKKYVKRRNRICFKKSNKKIMQKAIRYYVDCDVNSEEYKKLYKNCLELANYMM